MTGRKEDHELGEFICPTLYPLKNACGEIIFGFGDPSFDGDKNMASRRCFLWLWKGDAWSWI
jgi:hypothetical protein